MCISWFLLLVDRIEVQERSDAVRPVVAQDRLLDVMLMLSKPIFSLLEAYEWLVI
jgi:hypothetical protein